MKKEEKHPAEKQRKRSNRRSYESWYQDEGDYHGNQRTDDIDGTGSRSTGGSAWDGADGYGGGNDGYINGYFI